MGGFLERILPGAFADSIATKDICALYSHDNSAILGRLRNGTLTLHEDKVGLAFELLLPRTQLGADVKELVARGDVRHMSFGFAVPVGGDTWHYQAGKSIRSLKQVNLFEISVVPEPAYPQTSVLLRQALAVLDEALVQAIADRRRRLEAPL